MFKSRTRSILFTQFEHGRLAGTIAQAWGNEDFDRPALDFPAFVAGVTLHDWGYGIMDNLSIGEAPEDEWLDVIRKNVEKRYDHATTDIVVKLHLRRLLGFYSSPEREELIAQIDERVEDRLEESEATLDVYQRADKITQLCDMISFAFCFESAGQLTYEVFSRQDSAETVDVTFEVKPGGQVIVEPWPFSVPIIAGVMYAFKRQGYPEDLKPIVIPFNIRSDSEPNPKFNSVLL
jgi:hypothetical protein